MSDRPATIDECAQIAHGLVLTSTGGDQEVADIIRDSIHDAYRTGANRALEEAAAVLERQSQHAAAHTVRLGKQPKET